MRLIPVVVVLVSVCVFGVYGEVSDSSWLPMKRFTGGTVSKAAAIIKNRKPLSRRQITFVNGGLQIGGLSLGGNAGKGEGAAVNSTGGAGLSIGNLTLGGDTPEATQETAKGTNQSLESFLEAAQQASKNSSGVANGAKNPEKAGESNQEATPEAEAEEIVAVTESEQFSENAGITVGANGQVSNLGGNLGITQGSDGSVSVGGENGINITPNAAAD